MGQIFVTNPVADEVVERLRASHDVTLGYGPDAQSWDDVADKVEAVLVRGDMISGDKIRSAPRLRIVARHGVGFNNVDLDAALDAGVWVTTTPGANARAVAEHVFALLLTLVRHTTTASTNVREGRWSEGRGHLTGVELHGRTLLLIGGGGIARLVLPIAHGFGMRVLVADPYLRPDDARELGVELVELDAALPQADAVSIHVPLTDETHHLLDDRRLGLLPSHAVVINTSRGGVIDEARLLDRLRSGLLGGVGLDVIEAEQHDMNDPLPFLTADLDVPGLIVTPHIGGTTTESLAAVGALAAESIEAALRGDTPPRALELRPTVTQGA